MADGPLLEVESLTFRYRRAAEPAIRDLSFRGDSGNLNWSGNSQHYLLPFLVGT